MNCIFPFIRTALAIGCIFAVNLARGEILDSVEVQRRGNEAEINIRFTTQVQYLRHSPRDNGKLLQIFLQLTSVGLRSNDLDDLVQSTKRAPRTDMVPPFTVTYPDANGAMLVEFAQATRFSVRPGPDGRSMSISVPILPGAKDWAAEATGKSPAAGATVAPPQQSVAAGATARVIQAIDLIDVQRRGKEAEISIHFTAPIQYVRHVPSDAGRLLQIYPRLSDSIQQGMGGAPQTLRLPETDMVPRFTVSYPDSENALAIAFDRLTRYAVRQGTDGRSISVVVPVLANAQDWSVQIGSPTAVAAAPAMAPPSVSPGGSVLVAPAPSLPSATMAVSPASPPAAISAQTAQNLPTLTPLAKDEIESRAKEWMDAARQSIAARNGVIAAARLNQVLSLPPNSQTEAANALMGEAREFSGELRRAEVEYESYLKNYPNGAFVPRVKERLATLTKRVAEVTAGQGLKPGTGQAAWTINGGISQYYYTGNSKIEVITPPPPGQLQFNRDTLSLTDQKTLISSLDFSARKRDEFTDTRIVLRDTDNRNYLEGQSSYDRLYAAYVEQTNKQLGYFVRAGRQTGTGGGVLGRFDGLWVGYSLSPSWRVNGVVGSPAEFRDPFRRSVYGTSVDYIPQLGRPGFSAYYVEQTLEGAKDRQAIGTEVRYFDQNLTIFSLLDYDVNFKQVNIAMLQGNLRTAGGTNYFANVDIRRSPPLSLTTALPGQISQDPFNPTIDFRSLFQSSLSNLGLSQLRDEASALTAISSFYTIGFIHPVTTRWQLGADYRQSNISGTDASGILPAQPGSGTSHVFSGQALGNGILLTNDAFIVNGSAIFAPLYTGQNYNLSYILPINDWRFDAIIGYYYQTDNQSQRQTRLSPTARVVYRLRNRLTFELDAGTEIFDEVGPIREQHTRRTYIYGGYRWDFN